MSDTLHKLRWRCRRGTLELDLMLARYLEQRYQNANQSEQQTFLKLLELEDNELLRYLMSDCRPLKTEFADLVSEIKNLPIGL